MRITRNTCSYWNLYTFRWQPICVFIVYTAIQRYYFIRIILIIITSLIFRANLWENPWFLDSVFSTGNDSVSREKHSEHIILVWKVLRIIQPLVSVKYSYKKCCRICPIQSRHQTFITCWRDEMRWDWPSQCLVKGER